jgi:hypothetical protein
MHLFADPTARPENVHEIEAWRTGYTFNRRQFKLRELIRREKEGDLPINELVCWYCECTHPPSYFSPQDRILEPEGRPCIGWSAELELCCHKNITFKDVNGRHWVPSAWCGKLHSDCKSNLDQYLSPSTILARSPFEGHYAYHAGCWCSGSRLPGDGGGRGVRLGVVGQGVDEEGRPSEWSRDNFTYLNGFAKLAEEREVVIRAETVLMKLKETERVEVLKLAKEITIMDVAGMCPHLSPYIVSNLVLKNPYVDCPTMERHGMETKPCPQPASSSFLPDFNAVFGSRKAHSKHHCGRRYYCPEKECGTYFYLYRARYTSFGTGWEDELVLCVVRKLGRCWDALDKRWLMQVEQQDEMSKVFVSAKFDGM